VIFLVDKKFHMETPLKFGAGSCAVKIRPDEWAPGAWAGTEGATVSFDGAEWRVVSVDLNDRTVRLERLSK
jgi:hypothetical protein